jgi:hypothetical protein
VGDFAGTVRCIALTTVIGGAPSANGKDTATVAVNHLLGNACGISRGLSKAADRYGCNALVSRDQGVACVASLAQLIRAKEWLDWRRRPPRWIPPYTDESAPTDSRHLYVPFPRLTQPARKCRAAREEFAAEERRRALPEVGRVTDKSPAGLDPAKSVRRVLNEVSVAGSPASEHVLCWPKLRWPTGQAWLRVWLRVLLGRLRSGLWL